jgi:hypothetical protein
MADNLLCATDISSRLVAIYDQNIYYLFEESIVIFHFSVSTEVHHDAFIRLVRVAKMKYDYTI